MSRHDDNIIANANEARALRVGMGQALEIELDLRAANARLQERVKEAEIRGDTYKQAAENLKAERDGWEALAKVCGEALEAIAVDCSTVARKRLITMRSLRRVLLDASELARAAIAMTPEEVQCNEQD